MSIIRLADAPQASAAHWTPEDMLRATIKDIESGEISLEKAILVMVRSDRKLMLRRAGTTSGMEASGMLAEALNANCNA